MLGKKLELKLEELRVEQFQTWPESATVTRQGTVRGHEGGESNDPVYCSADPVNCVDAPITFMNC